MEETKAILELESLREKLIEAMVSDAEVEINDYNIEVRPAEGDVISGAELQTVINTAEIDGFICSLTERCLLVHRPF